MLLANVGRDEPGQRDIITALSVRARFTLLLTAVFLVCDVTQATGFSNVHFKRQNTLQKNMKNSEDCRFSARSINCCLTATF